MGTLWASSFLMPIWYSATNCYWLPLLATARLPAPAPGGQSPLESPHWARGKLPPAPAAAEVETVPRQARTLPKRNKDTPMLLGQSIEGREDRNLDKLTTLTLARTWGGWMPPR